jgi:hypothetical protein
VACLFFLPGRKENRQELSEAQRIKLLNFVGLPNVSGCTAIRASLSTDSHAGFLRIRVDYVEGTTVYGKCLLANTNIHADVLDWLRSCSAGASGWWDVSMLQPAEILSWGSVDLTSRSTLAGLLRHRNNGVSAHILWSGFMEELPVDIRQAMRQAGVYSRSSRFFPSQGAEYIQVWENKEVVRQLEAGINPPQLPSEKQ